MYHRPLEFFCTAGMADQVLTLYGVNRLVLASATATPTSTTSGAAAVPFFCLIVSTSCWLVPSGRAEFTLMPYLAVKVLMMLP